MVIESNCCLRLCNLYSLMRLYKTVYIVRIVIISTRKCLIRGKLYSKLKRK